MLGSFAALLAVGFAALFAAFQAARVLRWLRG
jgi:hypothetical protein